MVIHCTHFFSSYFTMSHKKAKCKNNPVIVTWRTFSCVGLRDFYFNCNKNSWCIFFHTVHWSGSLILSFWIKIQKKLRVPWNYSFSLAKDCHRRKKNEREKMYKGEENCYFCWFSLTPSPICFFFVILAASEKKS